MIKVPSEIVKQTLGSFREAGGRDSEAVVLWLASNESGDQVCELYIPEQVAERDFFKIPPRAMSDLLVHLGKTNRLIAAQVHSHPEEAFHSSADDRWAIVRHYGAISIVVPYFATNSSVATFVAHAEAFQLSAGNVWEQLSLDDRNRLIEVI